MKSSKSTSNSNSNSDSYSSYESDNSCTSRISQTSPPFDVKELKYFTEKHSEQPANSDDDYETTSISDHSGEIDVSIPLKKGDKSAIIKSTPRQVKTSKPSLPKNIPLYYLQNQKDLDNRFKSIQQQNNSNLVKPQSKKQEKIYDSDSSDPSMKTSRDLKNRPKSRIGLKDNPEIETDFLEIIPPVSARPKTRKPSAFTERHKSALIKEVEEPPPIVTELNLEGSSGSESDKDDKIMSPFRGPLPGEYDPEKFNNLEVSDEIKDLFLNIIRYAPLHINLDFKFKPFVPDFIPSVGDVDAFLKISPPDKVPGFANAKKIDLPHLGVYILDEPTQQQSDPALLHLHLRATISGTKKIDESNLIIKKVSNVTKDSGIIDKWIEDVSKLHLSQPSVRFTYGHPMPPLELLLQPWPPSFELLLQKNGFPCPKLQCTLSEYIDLTCTLMDIPIYDKKIESLHLLFSLFLATQKTELCESELKNIHDISEEYLNENVRDDAQNNRFPFRY